MECSSYYIIILNQIQNYNNIVISDVTLVDPNIIKMCYQQILYYNYYVCVDIQKERKTFTY